MKRIGIIWIGLGLLACGDGEDSGELADGPQGSLAVTQGGAQDIAHFRQLIDDGEVPDEETFDQLGFFAEHAMDQPEADCGESICVHPQLAVAPRFDGGNWTMAFASFNTAVDPASRERGPVHLAIVVERSTHTREQGSQVIEGVGDLIAELPDGDAVTLVAFGRDAAVLQDAVPRQEADASRLGQMPVDDGVALYEGLALALDRIEASREQLPDARLLLVTSGRASAGIADSERIVALADGAARAGVGMSIVGVGDDYDADIPQRLAELGTATLSYAGDGDSVVDLLAAQATLTLVPLATDFELRITPAPGYRTGQIFGAQRAYRDGDAVVLAAPALFLGARSGADDIDAMVGRRGGGGGVFVRLWGDERAGIGPGEPAFTAEVRYRDHDSGQDVSYAQVIDNALAPGENPDEFWPSFSDEAHAKPFMMLNMFLAIRYSLELYGEGSCGEAMGVSDMMQMSIDVWQEVFEDPDIEADAALMRLVRDNVAFQCVAEPIPPAFVDAGCFGS